ncbi:MAG: hypothetical protein ACLUKN_14805 [Bacilli bacterium]
MADKNEKTNLMYQASSMWTRNALAALCASTAEGLFAISDTLRAYVAKQPASDEKQLSAQKLWNPAPYKPGDDGE